MIYIPEAQRLINNLFPEYLAGKLERAKRHDDYVKLLKALNDTIREARRDRSRKLPLRKYPDDLQFPDDFLSHHFRPLLKKIVFHLLSIFPKLWKQAIQEQKVMEREKKESVRIEDTTIFKEWAGNAELVFRDIILGPKSNKDMTGEVKYLTGASLRSDSYKAKLLGQSKKANKENFHLRFVAATFESMEVADEISRTYKAYSPKQNPYFDEPQYYDPDYKNPEWRDLLHTRDIAMVAFESWRTGEYPEIKTENDCLTRIQSRFTNEITLDELDKQIKSFEIAADENPPNFILHIRGTGKQKQQGVVYERLRQLQYWHIKNWKGVQRDIEIQSILMGDKVSEAEDELPETIDDDRNVSAKDSFPHNGLWRDEEAKQNRKVIHK